MNSSFFFLQLPPITFITTALAIEPTTAQSTTAPVTTITITTTVALTTSTPSPCSYTVAGRCNSTAGNDAFSLNQSIDIFLNQNESILYVGDYGNARVQVFHLPSKNGTTVPAPITNVGGVYYDDDRSTLYIAETGPNILLRWPSGQTLPINGTAKGCSASGGWILSPYGVIGDRQGNIYVSYYSCHTVVKWTPNATLPTLIGGIGVPGNTSQHLHYPRHMYLDVNKSFIYVADINNHRVQRFSTNGNGTGVTVAGGNGRGARSDQLDSPTGVYVSPKDGSIYVSDRSNHRIQKWLPNATSGVTVVGNANGTAGNSSLTLNQPYAVILDRNETYMYVADLKNNRVQRYPVV